MKYQLFVVTAFILLNSSLSFATPPAPVPQTGQTLCYNSLGLGTIIPCSGTGQDGDIKAGVKWPNPRFTDHGNGTVTDNLTGLIWTNDTNTPGPTSCGPATTKNIVELPQYIDCLNLNNYLGYADWRAPNVRELGSMVNSNYPFISFGGTRWSSLPSTARIDLNLGSLNYYYRWPWENDTNKVWPVRSQTNSSYPAPIPKITPSDVNGIPWPNPRFTDNLDGTITDNLTGLTWLKDANCFTTQSWGNALTNGNTLTNGHCGLNDGSEAGDWHLPNMNELQSLVDYGASGLPSDHPFSNVQAIGFYWSSSISPYGTYYAKFLNISNGGIGYNPMYSFYNVWPVRSQFFWTSGLLKLTATGTDLGSVFVGGASIAQQVRLRNIGNSDISVTTTTLTGTDASQFSVAPGGSAPCVSLTPTLTPSEACTLLVKATPASTGAKSANLTITTADGSKAILISASAYSTVHGIVTDLSTGLPITTATITLSTGPVTTTSTNGSFDFGQLAGGMYNATASKTSYNGYTVNGVSISSTTSATVNFYIAPVGSLNFVSNAPLIGAETGTAYSKPLKITGGTGPYNFYVIPEFGYLPPGLSLDNINGLISGTPTTGGSYTFWAGCMDGLGVVTEKEFTINVATPLSITTSAPLTNTSATLPYSLTLGVTGGTAPYSFAKTSGTLPPGLALSIIGVLSGTPTTIGPYTFAVTATDAFGRTSTKSFSITIETPLVISTSRINDGIVGSSYNIQLSTTGNIGSTSWNLASGSLPTGLQLNGASGIISGTPSSIETQSIIISVQDAGGRTSSKQYTIKTGNPLQITTTTMSTGYLTLAYSSPVQSSGGIAPITYSLTSGSLPAGLVLNTSTGLISGTPTSGGVLANITVTATDSRYPTPQSVQQALSIRVLSTLPQYTVTLSLLDGSSPASVTGSINCTIGTTCQPAQFNLGTTVTLTAVTDPTTLFTGWSGACTGTATTCSFYVDAAKSVTATFVVRPKYNLTLSFTGDGNGQVNGDLSCSSGQTCAPKQFLLGSSALLLPTPDINSLFDGWSGACTGLGNCSVTMDAAKSATATFASGQPVKVKENSKTFSSLQAAYNDLATVAGNTIMGRSVLLTETLTLNRPIDVTIRGGYDTTFATNADITVIKGQVIIRSGSLIADKLTIW